MNGNKSFLLRQREPGSALVHTDGHTPGSQGEGCGGRPGSADTPARDLALLTVPQVASHFLGSGASVLRGHQPLPAPCEPRLSSWMCVSPPGLGLSARNSVLRVLFVTVWLAPPPQGRAPKPRWEPVLRGSAWKFCLSGTVQMSKYRQMAGPATCWAGIPAAEKEVWGDFGDTGNDRMQEKQLEPTCL